MMTEVIAVVYYDEPVMLWKIWMKGYEQDVPRCASIPQGKKAGVTSSMNFNVLSCAIVDVIALGGGGPGQSGSHHFTARLRRRTQVTQRLRNASTRQANPVPPPTHRSSDSVKPSSPSEVEVGSGEVL